MSLLHCTYSSRIVYTDIPVFPHDTPQSYLYSCTFTSTPQLPAKNQRINQLLRIRQPSSLRNPSDNLKTQLLPNPDRSWVIGKHQVENGVCVALEIYVSRRICKRQSRQTRQAGGCLYQFRRKVKICFAHPLSDAFPSCGGCGYEACVADMRAAACYKISVLDFRI